MYKHFLHLGARRALPASPSCANCPSSQFVAFRRANLRLCRRANHIDDPGHPVAMKRGVSADRHEA